MALLPYPEISSLPSSVRDRIQHFEGEHERPSLLRRMLAKWPPALAALDHLYHPVMEGGELPRRLKEMLFVVSAHARGCPYCTGGHSRFLVREFGFTEEEVVRLREHPGDAGGDPAERAAAEFVRKISTEPYKSTDEDIRVLTAAGYSTEAILEITAVAAVAGFTTTIASAMHLEDDLEEYGMDGYF